MRIKIFFYSEDANFFYRLNIALARLRISFKILNIGSKIPNYPCLILTTSNEISKLKLHFNRNAKILSYGKEDDFEQYILRILAAIRIGYKEKYSELTFSIDPGTRHIGLVVFLDNYYLNSHTLHEKVDLIKILKNYVNFLQENNQGEINLYFKFGKGVFHITVDLVKTIYSEFKCIKCVKVLLIDEAKSSQIKIREAETKILLSKHEASALVLALRKGIEVDQENYLKIFRNSNFKKSKKENIEEIRFEKSNGTILTFEEIAKRILTGEMSLKETLRMYQENSIVDWRKKQYI